MITTKMQEFINRVDFDTNYAWFDYDDWYKDNPNDERIEYSNEKIEFPHDKYADKDIKDMFLYTDDIDDEESEEFYELNGMESYIEGILTTIQNTRIKFLKGHLKSTNPGCSKFCLIELSVSKDVDINRPIFGLNDFGGDYNQLEACELLSDDNCYSIQFEDYCGHTYLFLKEQPKEDIKVHVIVEGFRCLAS